MLLQLKDLPARLRQYASYEYVRKTLQSYAKVNILVVDLKSDALKERHWKTLTRQLRVSWMLSDLILGQVWVRNNPFFFVIFLANLFVAKIGMKFFKHF